MRVPLLACIIVSLLLTSAGSLYAACTSPSAPIGSQNWNGTAFQFCDGTTWQNFAGSQWSDGASSAIYYSGGYVGIGTSVPNVKLDVAGTIVSRVNNVGASTSIDWSLSNTAYTSASCGAFTFTNMQDGGTYTLFVKGTTVATCSFTHVGLTVKLPTGHGATTSGKMTVYSFTRAGTHVFATWIPGY